MKITIVITLSVINFIVLCLVVSLARNGLIDRRNSIAALASRCAIGTLDDGINCDENKDCLEKHRALIIKCMEQNE